MVRNKLSSAKKSKLKELGWSPYRNRAKRKPYGRVKRGNVLGVGDGVDIVVELSDKV